MKKIVPRAAQPVRIRESDYHVIREEYTGFCAICRRMTTDNVEPDTRRHPCDACGADTVYGIDEAVTMGFVAVSPHE